MQLIVGLTGGIGSGKSAAADEFAALGAQIVDTDVIARALTVGEGAAMAPIAAAFGAGVIGPDGALDRVAMRRRVFADPEARARLEAILHPLIRAESERQLGCRPASADYSILVVPLLVESRQYRERVRRICVVDCPEAIQIERVMARSGLSAREVEAIMAAQATRRDRLAVADDVIDNAGKREALSAQVARLHAQYLALTKNSRFKPGFP